MGNFGKKLAGMLLAGSLALGGLVGCGGGAAAPTTAKEVYERFEAAANRKNFKMDMSIALDIEALGQSLSMPITGAYEADGDNVHGTMSVDMSALGGDSMTLETYNVVEDGKMVQYASADGTNWMTTTTETAGLTTELTNVDLFTDAEFKAEGDTYTLSITGTKLLEALSSMGDLANTLTQLGGSDMLANTLATFTFDKDCMLTKIEMNMDYDASQAGGSSGAGATVKMTILANISGYGTVDASSVTVPDEVKSAAINMGTADLAEVAAEEVAEEAESAAAESEGSAAEETSDAAAAEDATSAAAEAEATEDATSAADAA